MLPWDAHTVAPRASAHVGCVRHKLLSKMLLREAGGQRCREGQGSWVAAGGCLKHHARAPQLRVHDCGMRRRLSRAFAAENQGGGLGLSETVQKLIGGRLSRQKEDLWRRCRPIASMGCGMIQHAYGSWQNLPASDQQCTQQQQPCMHNEPFPCRLQNYPSMAPHIGEHSTLSQQPHQVREVRVPARGSTHAWSQQAG